MPIADMGSVSLDQFVVTADQRVWHGEAKRFGGLELDDPVRLPPGRLRLVTSPAATGSAPVWYTQGTYPRAAS